VKNYVLDTNVILHDPNSLLNFKNNCVLIPIEVIEEIDRFKRESSELGQNARTFSRTLDALRRLVTGPEAVAEGLDDVVGRHAQVRGSFFDHLQNAVEHADDRAKGRILALIEAAQPVEVTEQLVRAIDEVNDHG